MPVDPLCFPVLYPYGEPGWNYGTKKELKYPQFFSSRLLMPEEGWIIPCPANTSKLHTGFQPINRFQLLSRVAQHNMVEGMARALDYRLLFQRNNRSKIFGESFCHPSAAASNYAEVTQESFSSSSSSSAAVGVSSSVETQPSAVGAGGVLDDRESCCNSSPSFLSDSYTGSPRHLKKCAMNALTLCSEYDGPHLFITATCNPKWPEIVERLCPGQTAFDRPDITCPVFRERLHALLANIRNGKYFGQNNTKPVYIMYVIEYQHRGLPHAHIVLRLGNMPNNESDAENIKWIDTHIQACYPQEVETDDDEDYEDKINQHMKHKCAEAKNGCLDKNGYCKRGYTSMIVRETTFDERGYPVYGKKTKDDFRVVPHNREVLVDWDGHINVEFCGRTFVVLYLYKYLFKGVSKVAVTLENSAEKNGDVDPKDEIKIHQRGRMLCAMRAMWMLCGYQQYPASEPACVAIKPRTPDHVHSFIIDEKVCDMLIYFNRPKDEDFINLKYTEFFKSYDYCKATETAIAKYSLCPVITIKEIVNPKKQKWIIYKKTRTQNIVRMATFPFNAGEIFWIRLLLLHYSAYSFNELRSLEVGRRTIEYETFQQAAVAKGLNKDANVATLMFEEMCIYSTPFELRVSFVNMTLQGFPTVHIFTNPEAHELLCQDFLIDCGYNIGLASNKMLKGLAKLFRDQGTATLTDYGLPEPQGDDTELDVVRLTYSPLEQKLHAQELRRINPLTHEMEELFMLINDALQNNKTLKILLQGRAGSGKTTFNKFVMAHARSLGKIALGCASTGLAASNYDDFDTTHSLFAIPVIEDSEMFEQEEDLECLIHLPKFRQKAELIGAGQLFIFEEISSQHERDFKAVFNHPYIKKFEGKILILVGDKLQIPPVVRFGKKSQVCQASIYLSDILDDFIKFEFTTNLRLQNSADLAQIRYDAMLIQVSTNIFELKNEELHPFVREVAEGEEDGSKIIEIFTTEFYSDETKAIHFLHPHGFNTSKMHSSCVLAGKYLRSKKLN